MFKTEQINDVKINPIPVQTGNGRPKGKDLFDELYANIMLVGKKKSGKSNTIFEILKRCATKNTALIVFCSTFEKDYNWLHIREWCKKNDVPIVGYTSANEKDENHLAVL